MRFIVKKARKAKVFIMADDAFLFGANNKGITLEMPSLPAALAHMLTTHDREADDLVIEDAIGMELHNTGMDLCTPHDQTEMEKLIAASK